MLNWLRRLWCRLFHKTMKATLLLHHPADCVRKGIKNEQVVRRCCLKCNNLFSWSAR